MSQISLYRGDSYNIIFTLRDKSTGALVDLTGATFVMTVDRKQNPPATATKLFDVVGVVTTPASGQVAFKPSAANTGTVGNFFYDVQMTSGTQVRTIVKDEFNISQDISK